MTRCKVCNSEFRDQINAEFGKGTSFSEILRLCKEWGFDVARSSVIGHCNNHIENAVKRSELPSRPENKLEFPQQPLGGFIGALGALDIEREVNNLQDDWELSFNVGKGLEKIIKRQILITLAHQSASVESGQLPKPEAFRGLYVAAGVVKLLQDVLMKAGKRLDSEEISLDVVLREIEEEERQKNKSYEEVLAEIAAEDPKRAEDLQRYMEETEYLIGD